MSETTELIAQQILNGNINKRTWGDILYNVKVYGVKGDGVKDDTAMIDSVIDVASDAGGGIVCFPPGTYKTGSLTVPANVTLWFTNGAKLSINSGATVTINGPVDAGLQQIFSGSGTAVGLKRCEFVYPQWWGAVGDGGTDCTSAFQKAINAVGPYGGKITVKSGVYKITDTLDIRYSLSIYGDGWSMSDGTTILSYYMDGKPLTSPAIKIHDTENVHLEGLYVLNQQNELRDGIAIDGSGDGSFNELNSFVSCVKVISNKWRKNFYINHTWLVSFRDCYAARGNYGWYAQGGTITTLLLDHCYTAEQDARAYYVNGAYYTTFISCATDYAPIGYKLSNAENVVMTGCACESAVNTAIDVDNSTVIIDGFTSVMNGTGSDSNFATMLNASGSSISARGFSEINIPPGTTKIATVSLAADVVGEYIATGKELLGIFFPKNARFLFNGQAYTTGLPTATGWKSTDIGKVVQESAPVEAGTAGSKYVKWGYQRLTTGNGNVLNTDWLALRALTGN